jgi:hypothetical protein
MNSSTMASARWKRPTSLAAARAASARRLSYRPSLTLTKASGLRAKSMLACQPRLFRPQQKSLARIRWQ